MAILNIRNDSDLFRLRLAKARSLGYYQAFQVKSGPSIYSGQLFSVPLKSKLNIPVHLTLNQAIAKGAFNFYIDRFFYWFDHQPTACRQNKVVKIVYWHWYFTDYPSLLPIDVDFECPLRLFVHKKRMYRISLNSFQGN